MNQILKESGPRGGEAQERLKAEETEVGSVEKTTAKGAETDGTTANGAACEAETIDDWPIILHKGLWDLDE